MALILSPKFWSSEEKAPILKLNMHFLNPDSASTIVKRVSLWPSLLVHNDNSSSSSSGSSNNSSNSSNGNIGNNNSNNGNGNNDSDNQPVVVEIEKHSSMSEVGEYRILARDAERTFSSPENRLRLFCLLSTIQKRFGDYAQSLGYAASFLLLFLEEQSVFSMVRHLNSHPFYVPGYWKTEAVACATDGYVFDHLLRIYVPKVHALLLHRFTVLPETFVQKWFAALCLHVLPFQTLIDFWEHFLKGGFRFLLQFGLSLAKTLEAQLLNADTHAKVYGLLRLDPEYVDTSSSDFVTLCSQIVHDADQFDISQLDFAQLRHDLYAKHLKSRFERKLEENVDEEESGSEEEEEDGDDSGSCDICKNNMPEYQCSQCSKQICEMCHSGNKDGHNKKTHKVSPL